MTDPRPPFCPVCRLHPRWQSHYDTPNHRVKAYQEEMRSKGWVPARGVHEVIQSISPTLVVRGPLAVGSSPEDGTGRQVIEGFYTPQWAHLVAVETSIRINYRRKWLRQLFRDEGLQQALLVHRAMGGQTVVFFGVDHPHDLAWVRSPQTTKQQTRKKALLGGLK